MFAAARIASFLRKKAPAQTGPLARGFLAGAAAGNASSLFSKRTWRYFSAVEGRQFLRVVLQQGINNRDQF
jgi:hypothetical protein